MEGVHVLHPDWCEIALASQTTQEHVWSAIYDLVETKCKYRRKRYLPEDTITGNVGVERTFTIQLARTSEQVAQAHELLCDNLCVTEVEPLERFQRNCGRIALDGRETGYRLFLAYNEAGLMVAAYAGSLMDMPDNQAVFIGTYAATRKCHQKLGLMREMFVSGLMQAAMDAHMAGETLSLVIGDCTEASEHTWNSVGRKLLCLRDSQGNHWEVEFLQPAIKFDLSTGQPAPGMMPVKEYLMARPFGGVITLKAIYEAVGAYYRWCGKRPPEDFDDPEAYKRYRAHFDGLHRSFGEQILGSDAELAFVSAAQRAALKQEGRWVGKL